MPLGTEVGLRAGDFVLDGDPAAPKRAQPPSFRPVQTAGWMKMPLGTSVDLGPGHIVLYGDPAPRANGAQQPSPLFGPCLLWPRSAISATVELLLHSLRQSVVWHIGATW